MFLSFFHKIYVFIFSFLRILAHLFLFVYLFLSLQAHIPSAPFHTLPPFSAAGYTWEYSIKEGTSEIEIQEGLGVGASVLYQLETAEGRAKPLPLSASPHQCTVRVGFAEAVSTDMTGVVAIGGDATGGALGRGGVDKVLQIAPGKDPLMLAGLKGVAIPPPEVLATVEIPGLEMSIVDSLPQEVLLLTVSELKIESASGMTPVGPFKSVQCSLRHLQADNQLPGSRYPVAISAARTARRALPMLSFMAVSQVAGARGRTFYPFIGAMCPENVQVAISEPLVWRFASIAQQLAQASSSGVGAGGKNDNDGTLNTTSAGSSAAADLPLRIRHLNISNVGLNVSFQGDPLTRPRHLAGGMVALVIDLANFQAAPIMIHGFDRVEIRTMRSAFMNYLYQWFSTELFGIAISLVRNFGVIGGASKVLSMLSAGVAKLTGDQKGALPTDGSSSGGGGGKGSARGFARGAPSSGTAGEAAVASSSSSTSKAGLSSQATAQPQRSIADVSDGLLEGAGAFGSSILRGFRGIVEKPVQGAKLSGVEGAMKGIAKGLVGIVATPVSGALDALSATAEGFDAALSSKNRESLLVMGKRRLPRVIGGDGKLTPIIRDGTDREAVIEQLGSALLRATLLANPEAAAETTTSLGGGPAGKRAGQGISGSGSILEAYEEHFVLPNDAVALLTNRSLFLVAAPGFAQLNGAAEIGAVSAAEVVAGEVQWAVRWEDVLALELRWSSHSDHTASSGRYPDRVVVHRRGTPGVVEVTPLARLLACYPETPQASQVKLVAQKVLKRYYQDPVRQDAQWAERHAARAALPADQPPDQLPLTLPSLDFVPTWHTNPHRVPVVYFWTPVAPPGYHPAADVATLGDEPPLHPVPCFRDDNTLRMAVKAAASGIESSFGITFEEIDELDTIIKHGTESTGTSKSSKNLVGGKETRTEGGGGSSSVQNSLLPPTVPPLEYTLIWRYNGERSVSMWMPVAPPGYAAMGAVVVGGPSVPSVDAYLCVRTDLTQSARVFDSPIWAFDPLPGPITPALPVQGSVGHQALPHQQGYQPEAWKVAIWPVDSRLNTFIAVRALNKPPNEVARSVIEVELKEMAKEGQHR
jgi:vacuolar protein sorting-associated protein 13A/C